MRIAVLADQHGMLPPIPSCDLVILPGDLTGGNPHGRRDNSEDRWRDWLGTDFARWIALAPFTIATAGNHDTAIELFGSPRIDNFVCLIDSGFEYGGLTFWGAPWIRNWDSLAFNCTDGDLEKKWDLVPKGTDVIVAHMPPLGAGDIPNGNSNHRVGCKWLAHTVQRVRPKLLTCGHIHDGGGVYDLYGTMVVNATLQFRTVEL